jgi:hypothetical protein
VEFHVPPQKTLAEIVKIEDDAVQVAEVLRDSNPKGRTREEIGHEFSGYNNMTDDDIHHALALLIERGIIYTEQEDPTARVIKSLRAEGRADLFGPNKSVHDEQHALAVIRERIDADYGKTGGVVIVRYFFAADETIREAPDPALLAELRTTY